MEFKLVLNLSEKGGYNTNLDWINQIQKRFLSCAVTNLCHQDPKLYREVYAICPTLGSIIDTPELIH